MKPTPAPAPPEAVRKRQLIFWGLCLLLLGVGILPLLAWARAQSFRLTAALLVVLSVLLLLQLVYGFMLALTGYAVLRRGGDPARINRTLPPGIFLDRLAATAIVLPVFNEEPGRVFQGLRVMYESLQKTGAGDAFDFFILSDSDNPNHWIAEEAAWLELCKQTQGFGRIFYRKRRVALHHKSGNIADFCRRWGARFRYMIVLDADSVMTGTALVRLVNLMEQNPRAGIIQTDSQAVLGTTLFQRILQFSSEVYGPIFKAGANYWQQGGGNFWGHNAIIRLRPFMKHCAIPELAASSPLGRRILSHDTVEAALMRRSGYSVWFAYDLPGSYEENPPHLLASLQRDQRWCFGNLQHLWFLHEAGLKLPSRIHLVNGILAYLSAPFWLLFLLLNTALAIGGNTVPPDVIDTSSQLGRWLLPVYILALLFLPKVLATGLYLRKMQRASGERRAKAVAGVLGETVFSFLLAPILMFFYTRFVCAAFAGSAVKWGTQQRQGEGAPSWRETFLALGGMLGVALLWAALVAWLTPDYLGWMLLVLLGPLTAILFTRLTASSVIGEKARAHGWFVTATETVPPKELAAVATPFSVPAPPFFQAQDYAEDYGLLQVLLDPYLNALHASLLRQRRQAGPRIREYLHTLGERLLQHGPQALQPREKRALLWNAEWVLAAHGRLWSRPAAELHPWWQAAFRHYNEAGVLATRRQQSAV